MADVDISVVQAVGVTDAVTISDIGDVFIASGNIVSLVSFDSDWDVVSLLPGWGTQIPVERIKINFLGVGTVVIRNGGVGGAIICQHTAAAASDVDIPVGSMVSPYIDVSECTSIEIGFITFILSR